MEIMHLNHIIRTRMLTVLKWAKRRIRLNQPRINIIYIFLYMYIITNYISADVVALNIPYPQQRWLVLRKLTVFPLPSMLLPLIRLEQGEVS